MKYAHPYTKTAQGVLMDWSDDLPRDAFVALDNALSLATDAAKDVEAERDAAVARVENLARSAGVAASIIGNLERDLAALRVVLPADDAAREQPSDGPPMPHPVAVTFLEALRRDFARDPESVIALLAADDAERGDG